MTLPHLEEIKQFDTNRLIPTKYSDGGESVLTRIADDDDHLRVIFALDHATNDRLLAENNLLPGIQIDELIFGIPCHRIVNAAFCHAHPLGSRFNGPDRGAWYAAFELQTAQDEVAFHKTVELAEVNWFEEVLTYDNYLADFSAQLHDIRNDAKYENCLDPDSYKVSQELAEKLLMDGSLGVVYPSIRNTEGTCLACFRPAVVGNVRKAENYEFTWSGSESPSIKVLA